MKLEFLCESGPRPGSLKEKLMLGKRRGVAWGLWIDESFEVARGKSANAEVAKVQAGYAWALFQKQVAETALPGPMEWS